MLRFNRTGFSSFFCAALLVVLALAWVPAAEAQGLQVFTVSPNDANLRQIDPITGATIGVPVAMTLAGETINGALGIARRPDGVVFVLLNLASSMNNVRRLGTVILATGVVTSVGNTGGVANDIVIDDIGFDGGNTALFGVSSDSLGTGLDTLYTLSQTTGAPTAFAGVTLTAGSAGHAIGPWDAAAELFHATGAPGVDQVLERIDVGTPMIDFTLGFFTDVPAAPLTALTNFGGMGLATAGADLFLWGTHTDQRNLRIFSTLDHVAEGIVVVGTVPNCAVTGQICGAANNGSNGPSILYSISQASGAALMVGPIGFERVSALAFDNATSNLWGVGEIMDGSNTTVFLALIAQNAFAAAFATPVGSSAITDISFRHADDVLFGQTEDSDSVLTINTGTGAGTVLPNGHGNGCCGHSLAFDFNDNLLVGSEGGISTVDQTTGIGGAITAFTFAAPLDNFPRPNAMDFHPITGVLFAHGVDDDGDSQLVTIDPTGGGVTNVGPTQAGLDAIAILPANADLAVTKVDDVLTVAAVNDIITYTITVTNNGPGIASVVQVADTFTTGTATYVPGSVTPITMCDDTNAAAGSITCALGAIDPGAMATVTFQVTATAGGSIVNDVDVTTGANDPNLANNTAQVVTGVGSADVAVTKVENSTDPIAHPGVISYTITVTNTDAAATAGGVTVTDTFTGAAVTFNSAVPSQGTCNAALPIVCNLGDIAPTASATVTVMVNTTVQGTVTETATVTTATTDPNAANNTAVETTAVQAINLAVTKTDTPDPTAVGGGNITYLVTVTNSGNLAATNVMLTDNFTGAAATFVSATPSAGTCTPAFPAVPCSLGTIAAGANVTVSIVVTPTAGGTVTNTASATATEADPVPANNTNIVQSTTVAATQDFSVSGTPTSQTILPGNTATFTVTVTPLPFVASVALSCSASIPLGSCSISPATVNPGNLVATATLTVTTSGFFVAQHRAPNSSTPVYAYWLPVSGLGAIGLVLVGANRKRLRGNRRAQYLAILSLLLAITLLAGCPLGRDREDEGTPGGTYTVTITGVGGSPSVTRTDTVDVVVQGTN